MNVMGRAHVTDGRWVGIAARFALAKPLRHAAMFPVVLARRRCHPVKGRDTFAMPFPRSALTRARVTDIADQLRRFHQPRRKGA